MKKAILVLLLQLPFLCFSQENTEVKEFVEVVLNSLYNKDSEKLTSLVNDSTHLYLITKIGPNNFWGKVEGLCFTESCLKQNPDRHLSLYTDRLLDFDFSTIPMLPIFFSNKSYFECENIYKQGVFISDKNRFHTLSEAMASLLKTELKGDAKVQKEVKEVRQLEAQSRQVVINTSQSTFVLYISQKEDNWYLSIIDFASMDCSV